MCKRFGYWTRVLRKELRYPRVPLSGLPRLEPSKIKGKRVDRQRTWGTSHLEPSCRDGTGLWYAYVTNVGATVESGGTRRDHRKRVEARGQVTSEYQWAGRVVNYRTKEKCSFSFCIDSLCENLMLKIWHVSTYRIGTKPVTTLLIYCRQGILTFGIKMTLKRYNSMCWWMGPQC